MLERLAKRRQRVPVNIFAVAWAEFVCGPVPPSAIEDAAELLGEPVPLGGIEASVAARLFNESGRRRVAATSSDSQSSAFPSRS